VMQQVVAVLPMINRSGGLPSLRKLGMCLKGSDRRSTRPARAVYSCLQKEYLLIVLSTVQCRTIVLASVECESISRLS
jgi:hypothetical protein